MNNPMMPVLFLFLGLTGSSVLSMAVGWFFISASDRTMKIAAWLNALTVLAMIGVAGTMVYCVFRADNVTEAAFSVVQPWVCGALIFAAFISAGFLRGLSL